MQEAGEISNSLKKMVRGAGFEPAKLGFSSLLIVTFLYTYLPVATRKKPRKFKLFVVFVGNFG